MKRNLLWPLIRDGVRLPFFIVPSAGTTPLSLVRLARALRSQRPVYSFEFAGMLNDQPPHASIEEMASSYVDEIQNVQKSGPYYLGGHCFGGTVALDIATKLEARGEKVAVLALVESIPPPSNKAAEDRDVTNEQDQCSAAVAEREKALHLIFEQIRKHLMRLSPAKAESFKQFYREQTRIGSRYRASSINTAIVLLRTPTHPSVIFQGWKQLSTRSFTEHIVPGDAFSILSPPDVGILGAELDKALSVPQSEGC